VVRLQGPRVEVYQPDQKPRTASPGSSSKRRESSPIRSRWRPSGTARPRAG
jgi:hypothetical protein